MAGDGGSEDPRVKPAPGGEDGVYYVLEEAAVVTGEAACLMSAKELAKERAAAENAGLLALATAQAAGVAAMPTFEVEVAEARSLMAADKNGKSDPYAVVELVADAGGKALKGESFKTKTHKKTLDPKFDESFTLGAAEALEELTDASVGADTMRELEDALEGNGQRRARLEHDGAGVRMTGNLAPKPVFHGTSVQIALRGTLMIEFEATGEVYSASVPDLHIRFFGLGGSYNETVGKVRFERVDPGTTGDNRRLWADLHFKPRGSAGWRSKANRMEGCVYEASPHSKGGCGAGRRRLSSNTSRSLGLRSRKHTACSENDGARCGATPTGRWPPVRRRRTFSPSGALPAKSSPMAKQTTAAMAIGEAATRFKYSSTRP